MSREGFERRLREAGTYWAAAVLLLEQWRETRPRSPARRSNGRAYVTFQWTPLDAGDRLSSRPQSLSRPAIDELPHVRVRDDDEFEVSVELGFERALGPLLREMSTVAAAHPNETDDDFEIPAGELCFPVTLRDPERQLDVVVRLVGDAVAAGATIVVLPELSTSREIVEAIRHELEEIEETVLVVAGSFHAGEGASAENLAHGVLSDCDDDLVHAKLVPFSDELNGRAVPSKEAIHENVPARLTVYAAREFRLCLPICKDFLDRGVADLLDRLAVNVLLVPAMSRKTDPFAGRARAHVDDAQALSVVCNGPLAWRETSGVTPIRPSTVLGQPVAGTEVHAVRDAAPLHVIPLSAVPRHISRSC